MHCIWLLGWKIYGHFSFLNGNPKTINFNYWWIFLKQNRGRYIIHCQVHHVSGEHNKGQSQDIKGQLGEKKGSCEAYLSDNLSPNKMEFQWWTLPFGLWRFILTTRTFLPQNSIYHTETHLSLKNRIKADTVIKNETLGVKRSTWHCL